MSRKSREAIRDSIENAISRFLRNFQATLRMSSEVFWNHSMSTKNTKSKGEITSDQRRDQDFRMGEEGGWGFEWRRVTNFKKLPKTVAKWSILSPSPPLLLPCLRCYQFLAPFPIFSIFLHAAEIVIKPHQSKINARKSESLPFESLGELALHLLESSTT